MHTIKDTVLLLDSAVDQMADLSLLPVLMKLKEALFSLRMSAGLPAEAAEEIHALSEQLCESGKLRCTQKPTALIRRLVYIICLFPAQKEANLQTLCFQQSQGIRWAEAMEPDLLQLMDTLPPEMRQEEIQAWQDEKALLKSNYHHLLILYKATLQAGMIMLRQYRTQELEQTSKTYLPEERILRRADREIAQRETLEKKWEDFFSQDGYSSLSPVLHHVSTLQGGTSP